MQIHRDRESRLEVTRDGVGESWELLLSICMGVFNEVMKRALK